MKRYIREDVISGQGSIYGMANLKSSEIGQPFDLWVDELGSDRKAGHNNPRFKPKANGIQLDIMLKSNGTAEIINADPRKIQKFKYGEESVKFIEQFSEPLMMHWNGEISSSELSAIIRLVVKKGYSIDDAIEAVLNDEY